MKKTVKILSIVLMVMTMAMVAMPVFATSIGSFIPDKPEYGTQAQQIQQTCNRLVVLIQVVGAVIAVIIIVILGIKYMTASPEGKADFKGAAVPYIVGAILVFAGSQIAAIIINMATGIKA